MLLDFLFYALIGAIVAFLVMMIVLTVRLNRARARARARRQKRGYTCLLFIPHDALDRKHKCMMCGELEADHVDFDEWAKGRANRPITDEERDETTTGMWPS